MRYQDYGGKEKALSHARDEQDLEDYVWATSEEARLRALSLFVIRSIVEKHGGTVQVDLETDTIQIDVPESEQVACAREIEEQVGGMCR